MKRRKPLPELKPIYVRPQLDRRMREASRAWADAAYSGHRHRPKLGEFDPLQLRMGMRACRIEARAGWAVSNPLYDQTLVKNPGLDPSLPGMAWLWDLYRSHQHRELVLPPATRAAMEASDAAARASRPRLDRAVEADAGGAQLELGW